MCSLIVVAAAPYQEHNCARFMLAVDRATELTAPNEPVVDAKGEFIFRPRATPLVYETLTDLWLKRYPQFDHGPEQIVAADACVSLRGSSKFPARTLAFLKSNFIPIDRMVSVAGEFIGRCGPGVGSDNLRFHTAISAEYDVQTETGMARGMLDGQPVTGPVFIAPGDHVYHAAAPTGQPVAIIWHRAVQQGYGVHWDWQDRK